MLNYTEMFVNGLGYLIKIDEDKNLYVLTKSFKKVKVYEYEADEDKFTFDLIGQYNADEIFDNIDVDIDEERLYNTHIIIREEYGYDDKEVRERAKEELAQYTEELITQL